MMWSCKEQHSAAGSTGSGKTLLAQTLARILNVPFAIADATSLTEAGYVGEDVENILLKLIQAADYDVEKAERGIIYIDEVDKIARKSENPLLPGMFQARSTAGPAEDSRRNCGFSAAPGGRKHPHQEFIQIDTTNILFICGGAFDGLEKIIESRIGKKTLGFGADVRPKSEKQIGDLFRQLMPEDLLRYGLIPEFIGRLPVVVALDSLDEEALIRILQEPRNSLVKQYKKLFDLDGVELEFAPGALAAIAKKALARKTGARGLRSIMEEIMLQLMYEIPSRTDIKRCIITQKVVEGLQEPEVIRSRKEEKKEETA